MNQMDNIQKYRIKWLGIEITRKCNYKCVHCLRGDAQNLTITPEIIDTVFSQCYQIDKIVILGGETLLELDMLQYLVESIEKYNLQTKELSMVTNGSILDPRLIEILSAFTDGDLFRQVSVIISSDHYHDILQAEKADKFYNSLDYNRGQIIITTTKDIDKPTANEQLAYVGKAKKYIDENMEQLYNSGTKIIYYPENFIRSHQICIKTNNVVECQLLLCANGQIGLQADADYITLDQLAFGNVLQFSLASLFDTHNNKCPYLCDECYNEILYKNMATFLRVTPPEKEQKRLYYTLLSKRIELTWAIRELAQQRFPHIPLQDIINVISVPSQKEWADLLGDLCSRDIGERAANVYLRHYRTRFPDTDDELLMTQSIYKYILRLINNTPKEAYPKLCWGKDFSKTDLYKKLLLLEQEYITGRQTNPPKINVCKLIPDTYWEDKNIQN